MPTDVMRHRLLCLLILVIVVASAGCPRSKPQPLVPLPLDSRAPQEAIATDPTYAPVCRNLGNAWRDAAAWEEAIACYERLVELRPTNAHDWPDLGVAYLEASKRSGATTCARGGATPRMNEWNRGGHLLR